MKKILSILIVIIFSSNYKIFAENESSPYSISDNYWIFQERVENVCNEYKKTKTLLKIEDNYNKIDWGFIFENMKKEYKTNMNNLYKCALINSQKKALELIKKDLINKNPELLDKVW